MLEVLSFCDLERVLRKGREKKDREAFRKVYLLKIREEALSQISYS